MMLVLTIISMVLYGVNKYYHYVPFITYHGFIRCLCFFFMGNLFHQTGYLKRLQHQNDLLIGGSALLLSIIFFYWHIHEVCFTIHIILYYAVNIISVIGIIYLCRSLDNIRIEIVTLISTGTMLIFGTHRIIIGFIDYAFEKVFQISDISYSLANAIILTVGIELVLLPLILYSQKHWLIMLGKKNN